MPLREVDQNKHFQMRWERFTGLNSRDTLKSPSIYFDHHSVSASFINSWYSFTFKGWAVGCPQCRVAGHSLSLASIKELRTSMNAVFNTLNFPNYWCWGNGNSAGHNTEQADVVTTHDAWLFCCPPPSPRWFLIDGSQQAASTGCWCYKVNKLGQTARR